MRTYHFGSINRDVREIFKRNIKNKDGKGFEMRVKRVAAVVTAVAALLAGALGGARRQWLMKHSLKRHKPRVTHLPMIFRLVR